MAEQRLTMEEVMGTLRSMFQDIDDTVIQTILEANEGRVEDSIDQLLQIQNSQTEGSQQPTSAASSEAEDVSHTSQQHTSTAPPQGAQHQSERERVPRRDSHGTWRHPLPRDFLKVPGSSMPTRSQGRSVMTDAQLFEMLDSEEGAEILRRDPRLAAYVQAEQEYWRRSQRLRGQNGQGQPQRRSLSVAEALERSQGESDTWGSIKRGVQNMGTGVKNRFQSVAEKIRRYKNERRNATPGQYSSLNAEPNDEENEDIDRMPLNQENEHNQGNDKRNQRPKSTTQRGTYSILDDDDTELVLDESMSPADEQDGLRDRGNREP
eukprot:gb/GECG01016708.1/.p1 GENE.gb/GECG01016708.1/~~gb/GECG01016708.1/.p1  ORF type:complete len:321 (+),score=59.71 gb/GECG01016708.1/:1-963(+)